LHKKRSRIYTVSLREGSAPSFSMCAKRVVALAALAAVPALCEECGDHCDEDNAALLQYRASPAPGFHGYHTSAGAVNFDMPTEGNGTLSTQSSSITCKGEAFFDCFDFFSGDDPTHGDVTYLTRAEAERDHLVGTSGSSGAVFMASTTGTGARPKSIRLMTKQTYNKGLFILDVAHVPTGPGTWPAWWMYGPNWPYNGEFDMFEIVNAGTESKTSIHTSKGCEMPQVPGIDNGGRGWTGPGDSGNDGAGVFGNSAGSALNNMGGGIYAVHWTSAGLAMYFFPRNKVPSNMDDPSTWGAPWRLFPFGPKCPSSHFGHMKVTFDLTFCGDWAGNVFAGGMAACIRTVRNTPNEDAYWGINSMRILDV